MRAGAPHGAPDTTTSVYFGGPGSNLIEVASYPSAAADTPA